MDDILILIKKRREISLKKDNLQKNLLKIIEEEKYINNKILSTCGTSDDGHIFIENREECMYGETFYICSICGYEKM
jgi:hypothetical protein